MGNVGAAGCGGEGQKSRRKREGGKARGMWERWGVGEGQKSQRKRRGRTQGIVVKIAKKRGGKVRRDKGAEGRGRGAKVAEKRGGKGAEG